MQFYKYSGFVTNEAWAEENADRHAWREKARKLALTSEDFNRKLRGKAYYFIADADEDMLMIGIINRAPDAPDKYLNAYLDALGVELKHTDMEETTFHVARGLLSRASRNDYISDDDEVLEQFDLDQLGGRHYRGFDFGENLVDRADRDEVYAAAERFLARDTFLPELDRIYTPVPKRKNAGHPVHYMIRTDDRETRNRMYQTLLRALYENGRLHSRRYAYLDIESGGGDFSKSSFDCLYKSCAGGAVVVRFHTNGDTEDEYANCERELIEFLCETMRKYANRVLTVFCLPRECAKAKDIFYEHLGSTGIIELKEEFVSGERAERFLKMLAKDAGVRTDKKLFAKLEDDKGYLAPDLHVVFDEWYNQKLKTGIYPQYRDIASAKVEVAKKAPKGSAYDELMEMIGLDEAKKVIRQALDYYKAQKIFADKGMTLDRPAMHMIFTGNPGTARTSVARLFAKIMRDNGLLSKGHLVEVGRGDLVGKYVGWTAPAVQKKFRDAKGGVLFIDEAYSLADEKDGSFGDEAINTIVQEMENHRDDVVVIFAGYPDKMERFLQKNPGLRSRIAFHVPFADYNTKDLCEIARLIAKKKGLTLSEDACGKLEDVFDAARSEADFGNGRYVRNVIEQAKMAQATRLLSMDLDSIRRRDVVTLCADDITQPALSHKQPRRSIGFAG